MSAFANPIEALRPWGTPNEKALRRRLHTAMILGAARATTSAYAPARTIYWEVSGIATQWVFASASEDDLKALADGMARLLSVATMLEEIEERYHG